MKAAVYTRYGPPEVVQIKDVPRPTPNDDEVLIRVHATTVNRTDCGFLRGKPFIVRFFSGLPNPRQPILGNEFAGEIEAVGKDVTAFTVGDRVFGYCEGPFGAHAEYMTLPETASLTTMPANKTYVEMAPGTEGAHYALSNIRKAKITAGQRVLVNGATGAIGSAALQLVKHIGAEVTAVCGTAQMDLVASLGADEVIDYQTTDFTQHDQTYDCVFDAVGKSTFGRCERLLKPGGIYMSTELGPYWQNPILGLLPTPSSRKRILFPIPTHSQEDIVFLKGLIEHGHFRPVIDQRYPLGDIVEAYRYVETGQKIGNVVITVAPEPSA